MDITEAIAKRRSIRKFLDKGIEPGDVEKILQAGIMAPSAKNRQPWKFIVAGAKDREEMVRVMRGGLEREKQGAGLFKGAGQLLAWAEHTFRIMAEAPLTIFIINTGDKLRFELSPEEKFQEMANIQSIGASIQNMLLTAHALGLGSLWINDIYFAYRDLCSWLGTDQELIAAVSLGYPAENPQQRPRKALETVVEWK
ncbi:MAG: nitroreductase [Treponema sp.]|jgi:nitroreductase|nr:nitroreductase [Treponema sp.]